MTIFDLVLIAVFLAACAALLVSLAQALTGNLRKAGRTLAALALSLAVYVAIVCVVSLSSSQRVRALGQPDCSDDWCVTPEQAHREGRVVSIEFRVWSRAKRVTQREYGINPYLLDEYGRRFDVAEATGPPFDQAVGPSESFVTQRRYRIEPDSGSLDLIMRDGKSLSPGSFVIGDQGSLLHPRTVVRIELEPEPV
jgi:hypothetical protein